MVTPQEFASEMLAAWQRQRVAKTPPRERDDDFERDIEIIRQVMERRR